MKPCLVDVNAILALLVRSHAHHDLARRWFDGLNAGEVGICRIVQLAIVRLLGSRAIMGSHAVSAAAGWGIMVELFEDERVEFLIEPANIESFLPRLLSHPVAAGKLVTDAYLAAFAMAASRRLVTLDRDFRRFRGVEIEFLTS
jgi:uncharacterized protein